jgi:multidrug efflux pump subunit AcrB
MTQMKNLAKFSVEKAITVFMAVIIVALFGVVSFTRITTDLFPNMNIPVSIVITPYFGASPTEVESMVTQPLEEVLSTTSNIKSVRSVSQENMSLMILEFEGDTNMDSALIEMRENLDMVLGQLPDEVGNPMIIKIDPNMMPIMNFSISKDGMNQQELTEFVESEILHQLERVSGVASITISGQYSSEIQVILDDDQLAFYDSMVPDGTMIPNSEGEMVDLVIDRSFVTGIMNLQNFGFPVGYANVEGVNYLVRVGDEFKNLDEVKSMVIFDPSQFMAGLPAVTLEDVASVNFVNAEDKQYSKVNGNNSITVSVQKSSSAATTDVTKDINELLKVLGAEEDVDFTILIDQGEYINQSTGSVVNNLLIGGLLAVLVLFLFLRNLRATFIVGVAIPISLLFAIVMIYLSGITLNIVSLGGLALGIGMLVDNSIVVMENIFRLKKQGLSNKEAAIKGTAQVGGAITASTLTTISVFLPIIFIEGFIKEIFMQMAMTIAFSLSASLLIALTLVPSISSKVLKENVEIKENDDKVINKFKGMYEKVFNFSFKFKYIILPVVLILFLLSIVLSTSKGFEYFPESDEGQISITVTNPVKDSLSFDDFVLILDEIGADLVAYDDSDTVGITLGGSQMSFLGVQDSNSATVSVILKSDRSMTTKEVQADIEDMMLEDYPEVEAIVSGGQDMTSAMTGSGFQVVLTGYDLDILKAEATKIADILGTVEGLESIDNGVGKEADELKITVDKAEGMKYNITNAQVMGVVAGTLKTEEATTTLTMNGNLYEIYVYDMYSNYEEVEYTVEQIENLVVGMTMVEVGGIPTPMPVTVGQVASVEITKGFSTINRENGSRTLTITAEFEEGYNGSLVATDAEKALEAYNAPFGYEIDIQGANEEIMEAMEVLLLAVALGVVLIYMIMASQFQSLTYPFIIMFTIPLAFTGGFLILWISGMAVSIVALIGLIVLTGVVVNNGIVLVDYANQLRAEGYNVKDALLEAGKTRLRPIVMTALTTILALTTMALGIGEGAEMMQPMAVTTIGGLIYATALTLIVVPIMYYLVTKKGRLIFSLLGAMVALAGAIAGFIFLESVLILIVGIVLFVGLAALAFIPIGKRVEVA